MSRLLITGGTGSFGAAVLKKYLKKSQFNEIVVFSRDEKKQFDLMQALQSKRVKFVIGDTRCKDSVAKAMVGVDTVFHAAALKQVPTGEFFPLEVVRTNILGTENVFSAALETGVKKVILLSTDKAVYPINSMGMTKALAEKIMTAYSMDEKSATVFCAVRYGNVMASRGSVIPLFVDQIKNKQSITITDPEMTRFILSMDDALGLVELAFKEGKGGDIFIKKAPAATIGEVAAALKNIFKSEVTIKTIGARKGEKKHETLARSSELARSEDLRDFFKVVTRSTLDYEKYFSKGGNGILSEDYTSDNAQRLSGKKLEEVLLKLPYIKEQLNG